MAHPAVFTCAQCGAIREGDPVALGAELFCCLGCVGGGPCICEVAPDGVLTLRVGPFATQGELLRFASRLERAPGLRGVELTVSDLRESTFVLGARSIEALVRVVEGDPEHVIAAESDGSGVYARITGSRRRPLSEDDPLLPTRTRFRVFRTQNEPPPPPVPEPDPPAQDFEPPPRAAGARPSRARRADVAARRLEEAVAEQLVRTAREQAPAAPWTAAPAGEVVLIARPFTSFQAVSAFHAAIRGLHGVREARIRRFYRGSLTLAVEYDDAQPLERRLHAASGDGWAVAAVAPGQIEVTITQEHRGPERRAQ